MSTLHRSRTAISAAVAVLTFALSAPLAVNAEDQSSPKRRSSPRRTQSLPWLRFPPPRPPARPRSRAMSAGRRQERSRQCRRWKRAACSPRNRRCSPPTWAACRRKPLARHRGRRALRGTRRVATARWRPARAAATALLAPVADPSWDETSGYGAVEASRAETAEYVMPAAGTTLDGASGSGSVETSRVSAAQHALFTGDIGSMQEEHLLAIVAAAPS